MGDAPIILGNAPSTGSTLLRTILGRHPDVFSGPEASILDKPDLFDLPPRRFRRAILRHLDRRVLGDLFLAGDPNTFTHRESFGWDDASLRELCASTDGVGQLVERFFERPTREVGARRWLEKTPTNVFCFEQIHRALPDARFIHIVRDGRDAILSFDRRSEGRTAFAVVSFWYYSTLCGIACRAWAPDHYHELRYEDLVADPEREVRKICEFLDLEFRPTMLEPGAAKDLAPSKTTIDGWQHDSTGPISGKSVGQGRQQLSPLLRATFLRMRTSRAGRRLLPLGAGDRTDLPGSPLALQRHLGYETEGLEDPDPVPEDELRAELRAIRRWQRRVLWRRWRWCPSPTRLDDAPAS